MKEIIRNFKIGLNVRRNLRAEAESKKRLSDYYKSEQDPIGEDFVAGFAPVDVYVNGLYKIVVDKTEKKD